MRVQNFSEDEGQQGDVEKEEKGKEARGKINGLPPMHSEKIMVKEEISPEGEEVGGGAREEDWFEPEGELAIDLYQTDKEMVIQAAIAGVRPEQLDISIENDAVTIRGVRKNPNEDGDRQYFHEECFWGPFSKQVFLPGEGDIKNAEALLKDGVLTVRIPKSERQSVKRLQVKK